MAFSQVSGSPVRGFGRKIALFWQESEALLVTRASIFGFYRCSFRLVALKRRVRPLSGGATCGLGSLLFGGPLWGTHLGEIFFSTVVR